MRDLIAEFEEVLVPKEVLEQAIEILKRSRTSTNENPLLSTVQEEVIKSIIECASNRQYLELLVELNVPVADEKVKRLKDKFRAARITLRQGLKTLSPL